MYGAGGLTMVNPNNSQNSDNIFFVRSLSTLYNTTKFKRNNNKPKLQCKT